MTTGADEDTPIGTVRDRALANVGHGLIVWADREMPVLRAIRERLEIEKPFAELRVAACLHITAETANLARTLVAGGADLVLIAASPATTRDEVAASLATDFAVPVFAVQGEVAEVDPRFAIKALRHRPHLIFDNDGVLTRSLAAIVAGQMDETPVELGPWADALTPAERSDLAGDLIASLEETASGVHRLRAMEQAGVLPCVALASMEGGLRQQVSSGQSTLDGVIRATDLAIAGKRVVVAGFGPRGRSIAGRARGLGGHVIVTEVDPVRALNAAMDGFEVREMAAAAPVGDLFITASGTPDVLRGEHFAALKDGAMVCNAGHASREIALAELVEAAETIQENVRDLVDEYTLSDGRRIFVLARGQSINLAAASGDPASIMDLGFAALVLAAEWAVTMRGKLERRVYQVPREIDPWIARLRLQSLGISIDTLTPEQKQDRSTWGRFHRPDA